MRVSVGFVALAFILLMSASVSAHYDHDKYSTRDYYQWADRQYIDYKSPYDWDDYDEYRYHHRDHDRDRVIYRTVYRNQPRTVHVYHHYRPVVVHDRYPYHYRNTHRYYW